MPKPSRKPFSVRAAALKHGWRSGLEELVAKALDVLGIKYTYEALVLPYVMPATTHKYTPDFVLHNGIIVETKGRFVTSDRKKMKLIKEQHPDLDIRFVFSSSRTRISKQSKTTYGMWCEKLGFPYADKEIPLGWTREKPNAASMAAIKVYMEAK